MGMTLEEAIKHCEEVADEQEQSAKILRGDFYKARRESCIECAKEHRQLAEWLKKLKAYEEARGEIGGLPIIWKEDAGVRKCIGILDKHLMEVTANDD